MANNLNITGNFFEIIDKIGQHWTRKSGLVLTLSLEVIFYLFFGDNINFKSIYHGLLTYSGIAIITYILWLFTSKRVLFRSVALVVFWISAALAVTVFFYLCIYPNFILETIVDYPFIQIWGSIIVFIITIFLGLTIDCWIIKGKKLLIVFAVNNESIAVENTIRASIDPVVNAIQDADKNVKLVVLPFGVLKNVKSCVKYIKRPYTRADAIIFASVVDDSDSKPANYIFTSFSSRINERRFVKEEQNRSVHDAVLDAHSRSMDWNFLNAANDNCSRKIVISKNLDDMLRMYIGSIYLMKHDFKAALPYTNNAIYCENRNSVSYKIASTLYSFSLFSAAQEVENNERDYDAALKHLTNLVKALPICGAQPGYNKAMARVMFYKGDLKASEDYTRRFKDIPGHRWGYELNMGFYAINKKKVLEFVQHYKNLRKYYPCEKTEPEFAIKFLKYQLKISNDIEYNVLLQIAIAFLHIYINPKKANKLIGKVHFESSNPKFLKAIEDLKELIEKNNKNLVVVKKK